MDEFKILSYQEELGLSLDERRIYYYRLKEYLKNIPTSLEHQVYLGICEQLNKRIVRFVIDKIKGYELEVEGVENIPNGPVILASTHQDYNDHFNIVLSYPQHAIILNTITVTPFFKFLMGFNGIVYVDRDNPESQFNSKLKLMEYLAKGKSIVVFPEATYNCSPNKLHLPLHPGVIDMSRKMQVPIVPVVQEYTYDDRLLDGVNRVLKCCVAFGTPIYVDMNEGLKEKKEALSVAFSTMRYDLIMRKGIYKRADIKNQEYVNYVQTRINTWKKINVDINDERRAIYGAADDFYLFFHINDVAFNDNFELLPTEYVRRLQKISDNNLHRF